MSSDFHVAMKNIKEGKHMFTYVVLIYVPISFYKMRGLSLTIKCFIMFYLIGKNGSGRLIL